MREQNQPANIFAMFQRNPNCHYPTVRIDFSQIKDNYQSAIKGENVFKQIIPTYNNDKLYFTDAFILQSQIGRKTPSATECLSPEPNDLSKEKFESRVQKQSQNMQIEEIYQAEPDSYFCQICRTPFENYHAHIAHRDHVRNLEFSKGYKFVKEIVKHAQKCLSKPQSQALPKTSTGKSKTKPIRSKKYDPPNLSLLNQDHTKKQHPEGSSISEPLESEWRKESEGQKGEKNKEFVSIIKREMKQAAVEPPKIQTFV